MSRVLDAHGYSLSVAARVMWRALRGSRAICSAQKPAAGESAATVSPGPVAPTNAALAHEAPAT